MSYIRMVEVTRDKRKTKVWEIRATDDGTLLGEVRWFGRWRGYAFFPEAQTLYEQKCLRDIATFVESKSKDHRKGWGKKQEPKSAWERLGQEDGS